MNRTTEGNTQEGGRLKPSSRRPAHTDTQSLGSHPLDEGLKRLSELADLLTQLAQKQTKERQRLQAIAGITAVVNQTIDFHEVATTALEAVVNTLSSKGRVVVGTLQRVTDDRTELEDIAGVGYEEGREDVRVPLGQGVTGRVAATGEILLIRDMREPQWRDIFVKVMAQDILSELAVPLIRDNVMWGVLNVESPAVGAFDEDDQQLLMTVGEQILIALHNAEQADAIKRERERYQIAVRMTKTIGEMMDFSDVAQKALVEVVGFLEDENHVVVGTLQRVTDDRTELEDIAGVGYEEGREDVRVPLGQGVTGQVAATGESRLIRDMREPQWRDIFVKVMAQDILSELAVPLIRDGVVWGVLNVESPAVGAFDEDDQQLLMTVGEQILIALHNAEYVELQERLLEEKARRISAEEWGSLSATAGGLVHHIGNTLGVLRPVVKGMKEALKGKEPAFTGQEFSSLQEDLETIDANAQTILALVHALGRAYTGQPIRFQPVDINWMIRRSIQGLRPEGIEIDFQSPEQGILVETDQARLGEAITELIHNATKAMNNASMEGGKIIITSRSHDDNAEVTIQDNGPGLSPEELERAFEVFYRGESYKEGFGVGLSGIRKKIQGIGGDVTLESDGRGKGATATIRLPLSPWRNAPTK